MKKSRKIALMLLACMALGLVVFWATRPPKEPVYQGKRLSEWMVQYWQQGGKSPAVQQAIMGIGTNGLPYARYILRQRDTRLRSKLEETLSRIPVIGPQVESIEGKQYEVVFFLQLLGTNAQPVLPELSQLLFDSTYETRFDFYGPPDGHYWQPHPGDIAHAMARIGPEAIGPLKAALTNRNEAIRLAGVDGLGDTGSETKSAVVPVLVSLLVDDALSRRAAQALYRLGVNPEEIITVLQQRDNLDRKQVAKALERTYLPLSPDEQRFTQTLIKAMQED